jgi:hypothetical protein
MIAFYNEKVDVTIDGWRLERPDYTFLLVSVAMRKSGKHQQTPGGTGAAD